MKYTRKGRWAQNPPSVSGRLGKWTGVKKNQLDPHSCVSGAEWRERIVEPGLRLLPLLWSSVWGENWSLSVGFVVTAGGYLLHLAIGRYSCQSCQCIWTQERSCTDVCAHTHRQGKKKITCNWHLNYGGMLYKISGTFFRNLLLLQNSFSPLTPGVPQSHAAFWLLPEQHKRGRLTCLPTRVWHYCVVFPNWAGKLLLLQLQN